MKIKKTKYGKALLNAGEDAYQNEIIDTHMEVLLIGKENEYNSKEDWIELKIEEWLEDGQ